MSNSGYGPGSLCGGCLHHKNNHTLQDGFYHCGRCFKPCEPSDYLDDNRASSKVIIDMNNKFRIELPANGKAKRKVESAPVDVTGQ